MEKVRYRSLFLNSDMPELLDKQRLKPHIAEVYSHETTQFQRGLPESEIEGHILHPRVLEATDSKW
jgi:hypothetical protein